MEHAVDVEEDHSALGLRRGREERGARRVALQQTVAQVHERAHGPQELGRVVDGRRRLLAPVRRQQLQLRLGDVGGAARDAAERGREVPQQRVQRPGHPAGPPVERRAHAVPDRRLVLEDLVALLADLAARDQIPRAEVHELPRLAVQGRQTQAQRPGRLGHARRLERAPAPLEALDLAAVERLGLGDLARQGDVEAVEQEGAGRVLDAEERARPVARAAPRRRLVVVALERGDDGRLARRLERRALGAVEARGEEGVHGPLRGDEVEQAPARRVPPEVGQLDVRRLGVVRRLRDLEQQLEALVVDGVGGPAPLQAALLEARAELDHRMRRFWCLGVTDSSHHRTARTATRCSARQRR